MYKEFFKLYNIYQFIQSKIHFLVYSSINLDESTESWKIYHNQGTEYLAHPQKLAHVAPF